MQILTFGQIAEFTGSSELVLDTVPDTDTLRATLAAQYPDLAKIRYAVAVDKQVITGNTPLTEQSIVALLPPFSGG
jgi:molybdopterin converting factor small subunit